MWHCSRTKASPILDLFETYWKRRRGKRRMDHQCSRKRTCPEHCRGEGRMRGRRIHSTPSRSFTTCLAAQSKSILSQQRIVQTGNAHLMSSSSTMLTIFGGRVDDLKPMLLEERFSDRWEPRILDRYGLTMAKFNGTVLPVERGVNVKKYQ